MWSDLQHDQHEIRDAACDHAINTLILTNANATHQLLFVKSLIDRRVKPRKDTQGK